MILSLSAATVIVAGTSCMSILSGIPGLPGERMRTLIRAGVSAELCGVAVAPSMPQRDSECRCG